MRGVTESGANCGSEIRNRRTANSEKIKKYAFFIKMDRDMDSAGLLL